MTARVAPEKPAPAVDDENRGYWEAARNGELRFQRCAACGRFRHPPLPMCPGCRSFEFGWIRSEGRGVLYSWTVVRHPVHPAFTEVPLVVALVEIEDCGRPRIICNLDVPPEMLEAGMPVEIWFEERGDLKLPQARPAPGVRTNDRP